MRNFWIVLVGIAFLLVGFGVFYLTSGLKYYIQALDVVNSLEENNKVLARGYFSVADKTVYRGTLAFIDKQKEGNVWIWGKRGLKRFKIDQYTVFSLYETCSEKMLNGFRGQGVTLDDRDIYTDINQWSTKLQQGNFIEVWKDG